MVVVVSLGRDNLPGIIQIPEPVLIETGIADAGVEALYKGVLGGLPGWIKCSFTPAFCDQENMALLVSSVPLSQTSVCEIRIA